MSILARIRSCPSETLRRRYEHALAIIFCVCKCYLLWLTWNQVVGFDWGGHIEMVTADALQTFLGSDLFQYFYSYHPPLAFLLPKIPLYFGIPPVASVQVINTVAIIVSFLFFRRALDLLGILREPEGVLILYILYCIPLTVYLSHSVNMDVLILLCASAVLWCSVHIVQLPHTVSRLHVLLSSATLVAWLAAGLMTKFTGVLVFAIPLLTYIFLAPERSRKIFNMLVLACVVAVALVLPYYYFRYYQAVGQWFPSNTNVFDHDAQMVARAVRNAHKKDFVLSMFDLPTVAQQHPEWRDLDRPRLVDTWHDFWIMDVWLDGGEQHSLSRSIAKIYLSCISLFMIAGVTQFIVRQRVRDAWGQFGWLVLSVLGIFACISAVYVYKNPWGGSLSNKGIYVAPMAWGLAYLLTEFARGFVRSRLSEVCLYIMLAGMLVVHHMVPLY